MHCGAIVPATTVCICTCQTAQSKSMNQIKGLLGKVSGGHQTTEGDIKTIAIKYPAYKVLLEGYLHKRGDLGPEALRSWSKRYFLLIAPRSIFYFEDQSKAEQFKKLPTSNVRISLLLCCSAAAGRLHLCVLPSN